MMYDDERRGVRAGPAAPARRTLRLTILQLTFAMVVLGVAWRTLRYALGFPLWGDESFVAINFVKRDFGGMIQPLVYGQIAPLVFMWVELAVSRLLGLSEWALRLVPFLGGLAGFLLFWRFAPSVLPRRAALLAVGILAASAYVVRHGAEVKPYATDLLISLTLTVLCWRVWTRPSDGGRWILLVLAAGAAVWCSYPAMFVGGSAGLLLTWLLIRERLRPPVVVGWLAYGLVLCGSTLAMYLMIAKPHAAYASRLTEIPMWTLAFPPLTEPLKLAKWLLSIHTGEMLAYPHGGKPPGSIATLVLVVIGAVRMWQTQRPLLLLLLGPLPLTFVAAAMKAYPYGGSARTSLYMAPAFCLLAGLGLFVALRWLLRKPAKIRAGLAAFSFALGVFIIAAVIADIARPYSSVAVKRSHDAVRTLARRAGPADLWIIFNADREVPYAPYLGAWRGVGAQFVFDVLRFAPVPVEWAPDPTKVVPQPGGSTWLLSYRGYKVPFPQEQLDAYLAALHPRLGDPQRESFFIKSKGEEVEALEVLRYSP